MWRCVFDGDISKASISGASFLNVLAHVWCPSLDSGSPDGCAELFAFVQSFFFLKTLTQHVDNHTDPSATQLVMKASKNHITLAL